MSIIARINELYFSPTGTTRKIVSGISGRLAERFGKAVLIDTFDFTLPEARMTGPVVNEDDLVIAAVPVYAGRVPNILLKYLNSFVGSGALTVAIVVYGNRNYDDALTEFTDILETTGFSVIAAGAFIGEHSFSDVLAENRPDDNDMLVAAELADKVYDKITGDRKPGSITVKGNRPYRGYYRPVNKKGEAVDIRKVVPKTKEICINCKTCVSVCPVGSIDYDCPSKLNGICIKCGACIKKCPVQAKYYDDENYLRHKHELEEEFSARRGPELFI